MGHHSRRHWGALLATALTLVLFCATAGTASAWPERYESLDDAVRHGAIDRELTERLEAGEAVDALVILDGSTVAKAYGEGGRRQVETAKRTLADMRQSLARAVPTVETTQAYELIPMILVRLEGTALALDLLRNEHVKAIVVDHINVHWLSTSRSRINAPAVQAMGHSGAGVGIAVLDAGVDFTGAAFGSCTAPGVPAGCRVPVAFDTAPDDKQRDDAIRHGSNVAAIAAGVASGARIVAIDVFDGNGAWDSDILEGLDWVLANRAAQNIRAVNLSLGRSQHHTSSCDGGFLGRNAFLQPFMLLHQAGVLPVVAAGNDARPGGGAFVDGLSTPACLGSAFSVGATYDAPGAGLPGGSCADPSPPADMVACFSQDAPFLDLLAPGATISAAGVAMDGTSQAAPHVAGAAAVLAAARPGLSTAQLESHLTASSTTVTDGRSGRTHKRLDLVAALRSAYPVPNDDRAAPRALNGWGGRLDQTTWTATREPGEPQHASVAGGASVWFRWTASRSGTATLTTRGSDYDTLLAVYRGGAPVAANDDAQTGTATSTVQFPVTAGDVIEVAVDGKIASGFPASGRLKLTWNLPHDDIANALTLVPGSTEHSANVGATRQFGEPKHCGDQFANASVWYRWTPATTNTAWIDVSGSVFSCVAVYLGGPSLALSALAAASDDAGFPASVSFTAAAGTTYWIAVDGVSMETTCGTNGQCQYTTPTGAFTLTLQQ